MKVPYIEFLPGLKLAYIVVIIGFIVHRIYRKFNPLPITEGIKPPRELQPDNIFSPIPHGFIFGKDKHYKNWLIRPEEPAKEPKGLDSHIMVVGGSGTGKTSCLAIPSIMCWQNRLFAIDIKGELHEKTNRPMAKVFNPLDRNSCGYDPFYTLSESDNVPQDIREIATCLLPIPAGLKDPFWHESAQNLLTGGLLYFYDEGLTFIDSIKKIASLSVRELIEVLKNSDMEEIKFVTSQFEDTSVKTLGSIKTQLSNQLLDFVWDQDVIAAFSKSNPEDNIKPIDLERGFDIFLQIPEDKLEQWGKILGLITSQFLKHFERRNEKTAKPILFLLDEFARLGKLPRITNGLATLRSKKIIIAIFIQSLADLDLIYGVFERKRIADNCRYKAVLNAGDDETQRYFSNLVGTHEVLRETTSTSKNPVGRIERNSKYSDNSSYKQYTTTESKSTSYSYQEKRIIKPEEFATLPDIVLLTPMGFMRIEKTSIYDEKVFQELKNKTEIAPPEKDSKASNRAQNVFWDIFTRALLVFLGWGIIFIILNFIAAAINGHLF